MSCLIHTNHNSTENGSGEWAAFRSGGCRKGRLRVPYSRVVVWEKLALERRGIFLEEKELNPSTG